MLLVDTSVWIEYLRDTGTRASDELARLLATEMTSVALSAPVVMELLAGARDDGALEALERLANGLADLPVNPVLDYPAAAATYRTARQHGRTVRGLLDCLIAAVASRHGAVLVHRDADLAAACQVLGVEQRDLR